MFHIGRGGTNLGSFSHDQVRMGLSSGRFLPTDLGWKEGMENWLPLSEFDQFFPSTPPPLTPDLELLEPVPKAQPAGLPWDHRGERGPVVAFVETVRLVLLNPTEAFARMQTGGSLAGPLLFNLIGGWLGAIASTLFAVLLTHVTTQPADPSGIRALFNMTPEGAITEFKFILVMGPVLVTIVAMISALLAHLFMMLAGGAHKPFDVTLRVFCFSYGATQVLQVLPFCGGPFAMVWLLVCCIIGLAVAHGTTTGRAVTAMVLFVVVLCACCGGLIFLTISAAGPALQQVLKQ